MYVTGTYMHDLPNEVIFASLWNLSDKSAAKYTHDDQKKGAKLKEWAAQLDLDLETFKHTLRGLDSDLATR